MKKKMIDIILQSAAEYNNLGHLPEFWTYYKGQARLYNLATGEDIYETLEDYGEESDIIEIAIGEIEYNWNPITKKFMSTIEDSPDIDPILVRISHCIAVECYLFNLATARLDENAQAYHKHKIRGLALAVNCMGKSLYARHRNNMSYQEIEYFTISYNGKILMEVRDFSESVEEER